MGLVNGWRGSKTRQRLLLEAPLEFVELRAADLALAAGYTHLLQGLCQLLRGTTAELTRHTGSQFGVHSR